MAAGKSTVGRLVANRLGRRFVDLDERIEELAEKPIARIFGDDGEPAFRRLEARALQTVSAEQDVVVACGGGTPMFEQNTALMRRTGVVVTLRVSFEDVLARTGADVSTRPLLAAGHKSAERLYADREKVYLSADIVVDTGSLLPEQVAAEVVRRAGQRLGDVAVKLGDRSYPIHVAPLARAGELAGEMLRHPSAIAVVTDENVARAGHARAVRASLDAAGHRTIEIVVPPGEGSKSLAQLGRVADACVAGGLDRRSALVAVGGGVVGDLCGFVAAILYRGVRWAQVPTSLLAMVDSAIGGKTGVDLGAGKNLVGAFWQPRFVLADPATLETLPARERTAAFGEVLKTGLLGDAPLFEELERSGQQVDERDVVLRCARLKGAFVEKDEQETAGAAAGGFDRAFLNLGHTVGHAIEAATGGEKLHGECVALGLVAAARIGKAVGLADLEERVAAAVARCGLEADLRPYLRPDVLAYLDSDKKRAGGKLRFIALEGVGRPTAVELTPDEVRRILR
jgi:3-dehydroquinate synthase